MKEIFGGKSLSAEAAEKPRSRHRGTMNLIPFRKGQSGNPGGRSKEFAECQRFCRERAYESAVAVHHIATSTTDERLAFMAHSWIYETAWGKAKEYNPKDEPDPSRPRFDPRLLTAEQLDLVEYALKLMVQATRAPTGIAEVDMGRSEAGRPER